MQCSFCGRPKDTEGWFTFHLRVVGAPFATLTLQVCSAACRTKIPADTTCVCFESDVDDDFDEEDDL